MHPVFAQGFPVGPGGRWATARCARTVKLCGVRAQVALLVTLGEDVAELASGLATFQGVSRRFEHKGEIDGVTIIDDYGHHPVEIAAVLKAARQASSMSARKRPSSSSQRDALNMKIPLFQS